MKKTKKDSRNRIKSNLVIPLIYNDALRKILNHSFKEFMFYGGRGSCKSSFISIAIILLLEMNPKYNALILRKVKDSLNSSVFEQMKWAISMLGLENEYEATTHPLRIRKKNTGQRIEFRGADDPVKIKSIKVSKGYISITWFEELTEFTQKDVDTIKISTMRGGNAFWTFYSFNPPASVRNWCNEEVKRPKKGRFVLKTNFKQVPRSWLGDAFFEEAADMKETRPREYQNVYEGIATGSGKLIFENIELRRIEDEEIKHFKEQYNGIDWGYYPDRFAFNTCSYDFTKKVVYIYGELTALKAGNTATFELVKKYMEEHGQNIEEDRITADSAEPKSVADYREWGANTRGANKYAGSRKASFKWLQTRNKIIIDPERCPNAADEFSLYEAATDKRTGEILTGYPDGQPDHSMDAIRYATEAIWNKRGN